MRLSHKPFKRDKNEHHQEQCNPKPHWVSTEGPWPKFSTCVGPGTFSSHSIAEEPLKMTETCFPTQGENAIKIKPMEPSVPGNYV